jgi:molybdopterin synthase catalytic subunit
VTIKVQKEDFDVGEEIGRLTHGNIAIGGMACFVGLVRDMAGEERISAMTLEHYPGMTERTLEKLEEEARRRWPLQEVLIIHRYGRLEPGDRIVLVATASAHREASLDSCHFLIDWLKTKAPFWKLEDTESGAKWVSARNQDDKAAGRWIPDESAPATDAERKPAPAEARGGGDRKS